MISLVASLADEWNDRYNRARDLGCDEPQAVAAADGHEVCALCLGVMEKWSPPVSSGRFAGLPVHWHPCRMFAQDEADGRIENARVALGAWEADEHLTAEEYERWVTSRQPPPGWKLVGNRWRPPALTLGHSGGFVQTPDAYGTIEGGCNVE